MSVEALSLTPDLGRLHEIAAVLTRHGLGDLVHRLGLAESLARAGHAVHLDHVADLAQLAPPVQVRLAMEELGPTFVKLGQILAGRTDLFDPQWIGEFEKLHSHVPPVPYESLSAQVREDLGGDPHEVFARFDTTPLAAASIAQVHAAQLYDGTEVVVKIRRPGIAERIEADLRLLQWLAAQAEMHLDSLRPLRPQRLVREFARSLRRELDLSTECRNAERIAANVADLDWVVIPRAHWTCTRVRINVQDRLVGVPGDRLDLLTPENGFDRALLARRGASGMLRMMLRDGLFHADPHPGNIFYLEGNRIGLIDFGMIGRLGARRREELIALLLGLAECRPPEVAEVLLGWVDGDRVVEVAQLEDEIEEFVERYHDTPLGQLSLGRIMHEVASLMRAHQLSLPSDLALLIKAFISLEGIGRALDPNYNMAAEVMPLLRRMARERYRPQALAARGGQALRRTLGMIEKLPNDLANLMRQARAGHLKVGLDLMHLKRVGNQIDRAANRLSMALVIAALIIGSSIVMTVGGGPMLLGLPAFGLLGFLAAVAGGVWLLRAISRSGRKDYPDDH